MILRRSALFLSMDSEKFILNCASPMSKSKPLIVGGRVSGIKFAVRNALFSGIICTSLAFKSSSALEEKLR